MKARSLHVVGALVAAMTLGAAVAVVCPRDAVAAEPAPASPRFVLEVSGVEMATFGEVTEPGIAADVVDTYRGQKVRTFRTPAQRGQSTVVLKRGAPTLNAMKEIENWVRAATEKPAAAKRDATLTAVDPSGKPLLRYALHNALPTKLTLTPLKSGATGPNEIELTLTAESIARQP